MSTTVMRGASNYAGTTGPYNTIRCIDRVVIKFSASICWQPGAQCSMFHWTQFVGIGILNLALLKII